MKPVRWQFIFASLLVGNILDQIQFKDLLSTNGLHLVIKDWHLLTFSIQALFYLLLLDGLKLMPANIMKA